MVSRSAKRAAAPGTILRCGGSESWLATPLRDTSFRRAALGDQYQEAPFFRFPQLQHNPAMVTYFGTRNVAMFSTDIDSFDFRKGATPEKIVETVMTRLDMLGKGIILMHDFQKHTG